MIVIAIPAGFRVAAMMRETAEPTALSSDGSRLVMADGLSMHYRQWGPDDGMPVVLIHGTLAWAETWRDIAGPLGDAGFRVIAPDIPPFGLSQRPQDADYSRTAQAHIINAFMDAMALERPVLVGHSFGGGATVEAAAMRGDNIRGLVLLDAALGLSAPDKGPPWFSPLFAFEPVRTAFASTTFANPLFIPSGLRAFVADDTIVTDERVAIYRRPLAAKGTSAAIGAWLQTGLYGAHDGARTTSRQGMSEIAIPSLVIWGREDTVTPLEQGIEIADLLPNARLAVLEDVNHIPHVEAPQAVLQEMLPFLTALRAGAESGLRP